MTEKEENIRFVKESDLIDIAKQIKKDKEKEIIENALRIIYPNKEKSLLIGTCSQDILNGLLLVYEQALLDYKKEVEKDIKTARRCMDFKLIKCKNKECKNLSCPLNKEYD